MVPEVQTRTASRTVQKPVWREVPQTYTVNIPVSETRTATRTVWECVPTTETRTVYEDQGS